MARRLTIAPPQQSILLFEGSQTARLQMDQSIEMTIASLEAYGPRHEHWACAYSGGKDSSSLVTMVLWLILTKRVKAPKTLHIAYADTRAELVPLAITAQRILEEIEDKAPALAALGCKLTTRVVMAKMDKRFLPYILGRGVPPPNNNTLRWCTRQIKIDPMSRALEETAVREGLGHFVERRTKRDGVAHVEQVYEGFGEQKLLVLTGVRQGESAVRDGRIAMSCGRDGAECGQGWYQETLPKSLCDTLAPLLHWRVCHIWNWLRLWAPKPEFGDWSTEMIADAYGGEEGAEAGARTGCNGCPLATKDTALDTLLKNPSWAYLAPLKGLRPIYRRLRDKDMRLRKRGGERRKGKVVAGKVMPGELVKNQQRMGPLTFKARRWALAEILKIQDEINAAAERENRPRIDLLNAEEVARIEELIAAKTWPNRWDGTEPTGDVVLEDFYADGTSQPLLFAALEETPQGLV